MITKEQIDNYLATQFYTPETAHQARIDIQWVIDQMREPFEMAKLKAESEKQQADLIFRTSVKEIEGLKVRLDAALSDKSEFTRRIIDETDAMRAENERLNALLIGSANEGWRLSGRIKALEAENDRLRGELSEILRIAERGDVNIQPLLAPIIEKAKNALK